MSRCWSGMTARSLGRRTAWTSQIHNVAPGAIGYAETTNVLAVFAWTFKDALIAKLDASISATGNDRVALTVEGRQLQSAKLQADLEAVERDECELIWRGQGQGLPIEFRSDTNPLAILQCRLVTTAVADARGTSSPENAYDVVGTPR
jgi:hypothetical protein